VGGFVVVVVVVLRIGMEDDRDNAMDVEHSVMRMMLLDAVFTDSPSSAPTAPPSVNFLLSLQNYVSSPFCSCGVWDFLLCKIE
jgi:hypothetical protein